MWIFRSFLILIIIAVIVGFAYYNGPDQRVDVNLILTQRYSVPVTTVVFWSFILGALVSWLLFISVYLKLWNQVRDANRSVKGLMTEVTALRNRPIEETKDLLEKKDHLQE